MDYKTRQSLSPCAYYTTVRPVRALFAYLVAILSVAPGCSDPVSGIEDTRELQDAVFYLDPGFAFVAVVDESGSEFRLTDGTQLVMDNSAFERVVLPVITGERQRRKFDKNFIQVDARFRIDRDNLVVGVVQTDDGGAEEVGRDYWVLEIETIRSAQWCPAIDTAE